MVGSVQSTDAVGAPACRGLDVYTVLVFGHEVQTYAASQQDADQWAAKESGCMPFRHIYDSCPYMKALLDGPEDLDHLVRTEHNCKDHE